MRKNVIALMLILPLLMVFVLFSSGQVASINVSISVSGIKILQEFENDLIYIDLAEYNNDISLKAEVRPLNAKNKKYAFVVDAVEGTDFAQIEIKDGRIIAHSPGSAKITAISNDGGYTDSVKVIVGSSKPYNFDVNLFSQIDEQQNLVANENGYSATVYTGQYTYLTKIIPNGFFASKVELVEGFATINEKNKTINLPFSGNAKIKFTVENGVYGDIEKILDLNIVKQETTSGFTINGGADVVIPLEKTCLNSSFYVEAESRPEVVSISSADIKNYQIENLGDNKYKLDVEFSAGHDESRVVLQVKVGNSLENVIFSFMEFDFIVTNELPVLDNLNVGLNVDSAVKFYAIPTVELEGVTYSWHITNENGDDASESFELASLSANNDVYSITAKELGKFVLYVQPYLNSRPMDVYVAEVNVEVIDKYTDVEILNNLSVGLAQHLVIGGFKINEENEFVQNSYLINVLGRNINEQKLDLNSFEIELSNDLAEVEISNNQLLLIPKGRGEVAVKISWKGNKYFNTNVETKKTFILDAQAVEIDNANPIVATQQLFEQTEAGKPIVLNTDIRLDVSSKNGDSASYIKALHTMKSTYNTQFYQNNPNNVGEPNVNYIVEFKNNVYGNGHILDAGNFTMHKDGTDLEDVFRGPLSFVALGEIASVAGQDNIAFLCRTDNVTLYNVELHGCSDEDFNYNLINLNNAGTTLDINASVNLINCRIKNGRNVVRVYGGNRNADSYFVDDLNEYLKNPDQKIEVNIKGCHILHAREFLLKIGANKVLRTDVAEPNLINLETQSEYLPRQYAGYINGNDDLPDEYFLENFVLTDVTLENSVLEKSGLFSVGIESNFSGDLLHNGADPNVLGESNASTVNLLNILTKQSNWNKVAGTSFASVLHLVGDVRLYDWKELSAMDSSSLIESEGIELLKLDIKGMLECVKNNKPEQFDGIILDRENKSFVHGGIAFYGGGKNYSQLDVRNLNEDLKDLTQYDINVAELSGSSDDNMKMQGMLLPLAAGTQDFRFFLYNSYSKNSIDLQNAEDTVKYAGIASYGFSC